MSILRSARVAAVLSCALLGSAHAYDRIQPPEISSGQRAGLAGDLAKIAIGPGDVERGAFSLPSPFAAPSERGELQASVFPTYNPDNGISAWGIGFDLALAIKRIRITGSIDFSDGDELSSPFGRLVRGDDGDWYPVGVEPHVRVHVAGDDLIAYQPDGSTWTFGGAARVVAPQGTYAWHLREVRSATDRRTTLTWTANASGALFLTSVAYGGVHGDAQDRIDFAYESVVALDGDGAERPRFVDYRAGIPLTLDRRVTTVTVSAKVGETFGERWHYTLGYIEEPVGAAFYLARIVKTFASGESAPPTTYGWNLRGDVLAQAEMTEVPQLTQLFQQLGVAGDIVQPQWSAVADTDLDGNEDLELGTADRTLVLTHGSGTAADPLRYDVQPLPPASAPACQTEDGIGCVWMPCRPAPSYDDDRLAPRLLAQMHPDDDVNVVTFRYDDDANQTEVSVCTRDGVRIGRSLVSSSWTPRDTVRLVDLDHDHLPDFVRVSGGMYEIRPNITARDAFGTDYQWGAPIYGNLLGKYGDPVEVSALWVSDSSGDGIPDLEAIVGDSLYVWHGLGGFNFMPIAETFELIEASGERLTGLDQYKLIPADLNKDGLQDFFVTNADPAEGRTVRYFTNVGGKLVETRIPALEDLSYTASPPVIGGFDASGNTTVTVTDLGHAYSVALDGPETGLMAFADDGKGTVVRFGYARGPAEPGVRHRCALLAHLEVQTSGTDTMSYDYNYAGVEVHSIGKFPLGFDTVVRSEPLGQTTLHFQNEDRFTGVLVSSEQVDARVPALANIIERDYDDAEIAGVAWRRLRAERRGWREGVQQVIATTTYEAYDGVCPTRVTEQTTHGTLVTQTVRAGVPALANSLHCLEAAVTRTGTHADPTLDFSIAQTIARNAAGQPTELDTLGNAGTEIEQQIGYDGDGQVIAISAPGKGTVTATYDPATTLLASVTAANGVITRADSRDPLTDAVLTHATDRGDLVVHDRARYDGQERLVARWNDVDGSSAETPAETYAYAYATTNTPASVAIRTLADTGSYRDRVELYTGGDEKLATAARAPGGWVLDGFEAISHASREHDRFVVPNQATSPAVLDYATLLATPVRVQTATASAFGFDTLATTTFHTGVERDATTSLALDGNGLVRREIVNFAFATTTHLDVAAKLTSSYTDEAGTTWSYAYDALGRLRDVALPDGAHHRVGYDNYGRVSSIARDGIATASYTYRTLGTAPTDQVETVTWAGVRSEAFGYDGAGRITSHTFVDLATLATKPIAFYWDGDLQTRIAGPDFTKTFRYRGDGKLVHRTVAIAGFRTIDTDLAYFTNGVARSRTVSVADPAGTVLASSTTRDGVDTFGRVATTTLDDAPLADYAYDGFDRPQNIAFANGDTASFAYDPLTRARIGLTQTRADNAWGGDATTRTTRNARGFVGSELQSVGTDATTRSYAYSAQGFLTGVTDAH
jgi:YD repeat-containing protein